MYSMSHLSDYICEGRPQAGAPLGGKQAKQYFLKSKVWGQLFFEKTYLCSPNFILFELYDRCTRCSLNKQGWSWLKGGTISVQRAITWKSMRQEEARMRRNKMTRCSRKNGERLNPKAKQSWMAKVTPGDSGTWSGKSSCRQPCRISDVSAKSHLEEVGTPSRQSNGMYSSGGRVPGYVQESWQAEKGRETELLTYRGKT